MGRKALTYMATLIGAYLVLVNYTGFGKDLSAVTNFVHTTTRDLQGR